MLPTLPLGHESSKTPEFAAGWIGRRGKTVCPEIKWGSTAIVGNDPREGDVLRLTRPNCLKIRLGEAQVGRGTADAVAELIRSFHERVGISAFGVGQCRPCHQRDKTRRKRVSDAPLSAHGDPSYGMASP